MAERKIRHVEEIFSGRGVSDGRPSGIFEKKSGFNNVYKNKRAPEPPKGQNGLPKIGNYQPKIYMEPKPGSPETEHKVKPTVTKAEVHSENGGVNSHKSAWNSKEINKDFFIIGDKDIPMIIEEKSEVQNTTQDVDNEVFDTEPAPVPMPRRKRRAPSVPEADESPVTTNPLYGRSLSQSSDTTRLDKDFGTQGGDIDFANGIDNPGYERRDYTSMPKPELAPVPQPQQNGFHQSDEDMPYIPPPDYDDEELTMDFDEEPDTTTIDIRQSRTTSLYKDYDGEDFGKYLNDDMEYRNEPNEEPHHRRDRRFMEGRDQKFLPRPPPNKHKQHKKKPKKESDLKRNTIRDFTFTDSKIGWGDRTVKSTSAKGRYIKREKDRRRIGMPDPVPEDNTPGSYEEFLRMKNDMNHKDTSPNSSDSGVEVGDDTQLMDMYLHSQPKQYKMASKYENRKPSVWKRLTLRFKKSVTVTNSGQR